MPLEAGLRSVGVRVFVQGIGLVVPPAAPPAGVTSNGLELTIGSY